jgi:hypothetical protein
MLIVGAHPRVRPRSTRADTWVRPYKNIAVCLRIETYANSLFVILSTAKDLVFTHNYENLRSLPSLRMRVERTFAEVST